MRHLPFSEFVKTVNLLLVTTERQLHVLEFVKDQPYGLDPVLMDLSLQKFGLQDRALPDLMLRFDELTKETRSTSQRKDLDQTKDNLDRLGLVQKQVMFLMKNMRPYAETYELQEGDDILARMVFDHLTKETNALFDLNLDPEDILKQFMSLLKRAPMTEESSFDDFFPENDTENDPEADTNDDLEEDADNDTESFAEADQKAHAVYLRINALIQQLIGEDIHPLHIQSVCFCHYLHMVSLFSANPETYLNHLSSTGGDLMIHLIHRFSQIAETVEDEGPTPEMKVAGERMTLLRELLKGSEKRTLSATEHARQANHVMLAFDALLDDVEDTSVVDLASTFLYFWARFSILESDVSEGYFQKLERNWGDVFELIFKEALSSMKDSENGRDEEMLGHK